ncbi:heavy metal-binding domain-containing protein [Phenylobacterium sp.]|uniref:heavy metal-binding domain-containing protein n=1 Tax=Phenylobacterium sp. TaxID=1871053 RepID=UPI0025E5B28D|nr:heavy metal-binding domain-containing protein [Phenylobacterium sp.]
MAWFSKKSPAEREAQDAAKDARGAAAVRLAAWDVALSRGGLPDFVQQRLGDAAARRTPWLATMTASELLIVRSHGARPIATICGTCWFQFGASWTRGHASGWRTALERLIDEARACGANAVVDVKLRTSASEGASMDYSLIGTAIRFDSLPSSPDPVVATTPALEFVRLLEAGVVPVGIAVGAHYEWMTDNSFGGLSGNVFSGNQPLTKLGRFWESIRRQAHAELRRDAARQGTGVLAHTHFGQLIKQEVEKQPDRYLGRHIVVGTVVHAKPGEGVPHDIEMVVDMRDGDSSLIRPDAEPAMAYLNDETEGAI